MRLSSDAWVVVSLLVVTWLMTRKIDRQPLHSVGLAFAGLPRDFFGGLANGAVWLALPLAVAWALGWIAPVDHGRFARDALPLAALAMFVNVVARQLLLCGYLYSTFRSHVGLIAAVLLSGIFFSAYHAAGFRGEWLPALTVFLAGSLFCLAREHSGSLWLPIGIHAAWNFLLGPALGLTVSGNGQRGDGWRMIELKGPAWVTGGSFGIEGGVIVTVATAVLAAVLAIALRAQRAATARG
ncbi:MAG: CPBP family intramembrane glutamic endopeptidase [Acidobacteriota bacterium]